MHKLVFATCFFLGTFAFRAFAQDVVTHDGFVAFLVTGKSTAGVAPSEVTAMQAAHVGNFGTLAGKGQLLTAGPCQDPDKTIRGIVVLSAQTRQQIEPMFEADPYVKQGFMKLDISQQRVIAGRLQTKLDPAGLEEDLLVIFDYGEAWKEASSATREKAALAHRAWVKQQFDADKIGYAVEFLEDARRLGIAILRDKDRTAAESILKSHPLESQRLIGIRFFPQYLTKGTLAPRD